MTKLMKLAFWVCAAIQLSGCATDTMVIGHARGTGSHHTQAPYEMEYSLWSYNFVTGKENKIKSVFLKKGEAIGFVQTDSEHVMAVAGKYQVWLRDRWYIWFRPSTSEENALEAIFSPLQIFK